MENIVNSVILTAMNLAVHYGEHVILDSAYLSVHEGDRIGMVGRNGAGKSTFLKIISDTMPADCGDVAKKKDLVIGYLSQDFTLDDKKNVYENFMNGAQNILKLLDDYESAQLDSPQRHVLEQKILDIDGWNL